MDALSLMILQTVLIFIQYDLTYWKWSILHHYTVKKRRTIANVNPALRLAGSLLSRPLESHHIILLAAHLQHA